ncbi:SDR family oxidoreductase, partial [Providencia rettgeri]
DFSHEYSPINYPILQVNHRIEYMTKKAWEGEKGDEMKEKIPARRFAEPSEIAACALFLASDASDMITGHNLVIDGGYSIQ